MQLILVQEYHTDISEIVYFYYSYRNKIYCFCKYEDKECVLSETSWIKISAIRIVSTFYAIFPFPIR